LIILILSDISYLMDATKDKENEDTASAEVVEDNIDHVNQ